MKLIMENWRRYLEEQEDPTNPPEMSPISDKEYRLPFYARPRVFSLGRPSLSISSGEIVSFGRLPGALLKWLSAKKAVRAFAKKINPKKFDYWQHSLGLKAGAKHLTPLEGKARRDSITKEGFRVVGPNAETGRTLRQTFSPIKGSSSKEVAENILHPPPAGLTGGGVHGRVPQGLNSGARFILELPKGVSPYDIMTKLANPIGHNPNRLVTHVVPPGNIKFILDFFENIIKVAK